MTDTTMFVINHCDHMKTEAKVPTYTHREAATAFEEDRAAKANNQCVSPPEELPGSWMPVKQKDSQKYTATPSFLSDIHSIVLKTQATCLGE